MSEKIKESFCGLPLPDNEEVLLLQIEQNFDMPGEALGMDLILRKQESVEDVVILYPDKRRLMGGRA